VIDPARAVKDKGYQNRLLNEWKSVTYVPVRLLPMSPYFTRREVPAFRRPGRQGRLSAGVRRGRWVIWKDVLGRGIGGNWWTLGSPHRTSRREVPAFSSSRRAGTPLRRRQAGATCAKGKTC